MGRKKKKAAKPWCWYCEREFDDEKVLIYHQKAKHFKCHICHKKLYTAPGLAIHCSQVHKEEVRHVPNALPHRDNIRAEIYGMEGIPEEDLAAHEQGKDPSSNPSQESAAKRPRMEQPQAFMQAGMAAYPPPVGGVPGGVAGFAPGMMPSYQPPGAVPTPMAQAVPRGPLFPSASASAGSNTQAPRQPTPQSSSASTATFPAYQSQQPSSSDSAAASTTAAAAPEKPSEPLPQVPPVGPNCSLVHPSDDISMEEIRAKLAKYHVAVEQPTPPNQQPISQPPAMGFPPIPMVRPGMAPMAPPVGMHHHPMGLMPPRMPPHGFFHPGMMGPPR